jgi:putative Ig domain-containing protein
MAFRTDLEIVQLPGTLPNVGGLVGANTIVTDPDFGATIVRLTDGNAGAGNYLSMQSVDDPSGRSMWNTDDTLLIVRDTGSNGWLYQFNPATLQGTQLGTSAPYKVNGHYCFSRVNPGVLYVVNGSVLSAMTFAKVAGAWTYQSTAEICDFADILPDGFVVNWIGSVTISQDDLIFSVAFSQGPQDTGFYECLYKPGSGFRMLNTQTLAVTGQWGEIGTVTLENTDLTNFLLHNSAQSPNPNYTTLSPVGESSGFIWPNEGLVLTQTGLSGHHGLGFLGIYCGGPGGGQFAQALYATPTVHTPIIPKQAGPPGLPSYQSPAQSYTGDQHSAFCPIDIEDGALLWVTNGKPSVFPFTSCWMGELRGIDVTGRISGQQGTVYRACHTFNSELSPQYIVTNALVGVSQTGNFVAFTSDWGGSGTVGPLGSTSGASTGTIGVDARGDVFIVALQPLDTSLQVDTDDLADGVAGDSYTQTLEASGGVAPYTWGIAAGSLPPGLSLSASTGLISGTATTAGIFTFTVSVTDSEGSEETASAVLSITIQSALEVTTAVLPAGMAGSGYNQIVQAADGIPPYTWSIASGNLPPGLALSAAGAITGTPTQVGTFNFTVEVEDSETPAPDTAIAALSITIAAATLTTPSGTILPALYAQLAKQSGILALLGPGAYSGAPANVVSAFFFSAAGKQPPQRFLVITLLDGRPVATTLDLTTALRDGQFQFDSYAENQLVARAISQTVRDLLIDLVNATLPNGTVITFTENTLDRDMGYEQGGTGYVWRSLLRLSGLYTENAAPPPPGPQLYSADGAPTALHNNGDLYYDLSTGNLYEQQAGAWVLVGNIAPGGGGEVPSLKYHVVALSGVNAAVIKSSAGVLTGWNVSNDTEYPIYVKLYDKATTPNVGTDVPAQTIEVQAGVPAPFPVGPGITYSNGIAIAITKGMADSDATPVVAGDCAVDIFYQ